MSIEIGNYPDECPVCHKSAVLSPIYPRGYYDSRKWNQTDVLQIVFKCPNINCFKLFIANYYALGSGANQFNFSNAVPITKISNNFTEIIKNISPNFCEIYKQSFIAEQENLLQICGVGYRKALEFLVKDYLIELDSAKVEIIKKKLLGQCISEHVANENIKNVAKRAAWLGNDETHYFRRWEDKDLDDLKNLIDLTVHWIEMESLTKEAIESMPEENSSTV